MSANGWWGWGGGSIGAFTSVVLWLKFYGDVTGCTSNNEQVTSAAWRIPQTDSYYTTDKNTKETGSLSLRHPLHFTFSLTAQTAL